MTETELIEALKAVHFNAKIHENGWTIDHESIHNTWYDDDEYYTFDDLLKLLELIQTYAVLLEPYRERYTLSYIIIDQNKRIRAWAPSNDINGNALYIQNENKNTFIECISRNNIATSHTNDGITCYHNITFSGKHPIDKNFDADTLKKIITRFETKQRKERKRWSKSSLWSRLFKW